ncbi:MAG TPA: VWA domain-containing protein [Terriglobales bacterium]|nr:VWA domain-containing protein [Terriglobales bacterium]
MRIVAVILLLCATSLAVGQDKPIPPAAESDAKIKVYTRLVQVPVVVTDKNGKVVTGLTQNDFVLTEEGKEQKISAFEGVTTVRAPIAERKLEPGLYTNRLEFSEGQRSVVVMVLDTINTPIADQAYARGQLIKYLSSQVQPDMLFSLRVISRSGVRVVKDFTTDSGLLLAALKRLQNDVASNATPDQAAPAAPAGQTAFSPVASTDILYQQLQSLMNEVDPAYENFQRGVSLLDTISGLRSVAQSLAGIPGRKAVIWVTAGFPFNFEDTRGFNSRLYDMRFARMLQEFNDLNISIYPVDARGLVGSLSTRASEFAAPRLQGPDTRQSSVRAAIGFGAGGPALSDDPLDTLRYVADMTGGVPFVNTNDLSGSFNKAADDSSSYYLLGYYLTRPAGSGPDWRKIKVKVNQPGLNVRARNGIFAVPRPADLPGGKEADLGIAQRSPTNMTGLGMVVDWLPDATKSPELSKFYIQVNANDLIIGDDNQLSVDFLIVARAVDGKLLDSISQKIEGKVKSLDEFRKKPLLFSRELKPLPANAVIRFIVRDNQSGKLGSVIVDTSVPVAAAKKQ